MSDTVPVGEWTDVTEDRARGSERRWRYRVTPSFSVDLWVSTASRDESCPYHVLLSTIVEDDTRHVSDHPVAGYGDPEAAREALASLREVIDDVIAERDDLPNADDRLAHDVIPRFIENHLDADCPCRSLYDPEVV